MEILEDFDHKKLGTARYCGGERRGVREIVHGDDVHERGVILIMCKAK